MRVVLISLPAACALLTCKFVLKCESTISYTHTHTLSLCNLSAVTQLLEEVAMATYQAVYDYKNTSSAMLSFRCGDKFTVKKKTNDDWWEVESEKGATGLVPVSYLELLEVYTEFRTPL